jgi:hypothetical protein
MSTRYAQSCPNHFIQRTIWTTTNSFACLILPGHRLVNMVLTRKGREIAERIPKIVPEVLNARKKFTKSEFEALSRLLNKFIGQ